MTGFPWSLTRCFLVCVPVSKRTHAGVQLPGAEAWPASQCNAADREAQGGARREKGAKVRKPAP